MIRAEEHLILARGDWIQSRAAKSPPGTPPPDGGVGSDYEKRSDPSGILITQCRILIITAVHTPSTRRARDASVHLTL